MLLDRSTYRELSRDRKPVRIQPDGGATVVVKSRLGISKRFGFLDRLRFLFTGRVFVATVNGKAHTQVILTMQRPKDHVPAQRVVPGSNHDEEIR